MATPRVVDGYTRGDPDVDWWLAQIELGDRMRKRHTYENDHDRWKQFYRGEWDMSMGDVVPVNLFFMFLRTLVPRVYFRNPSVTISPGKPGFDTLLLSKGLENIDNKLMRSMKVKKHMKKIVQGTFLFGTGIGKLGFGGLYGQEIPDLKGLQSVEYSQGIEENMPWFRRTNLCNIVIDPHAETWDDVRWWAERVWRPTSEVRADTRLSRNRDGVQADNRYRIKRQSDSDTVGKHEVSFTLLWEVHDMKTRKVIVLTPTHKNNDKRVLLFEDDLMQYYGMPPYYPVIFNENEDIPWGIPDSKQLEPYQLEMNETRTQLAKHRRQTLVKLLASIGKISEEEAQKMVSEDSGPVVWVKGDVKRGATPLQTGTIPKEFFVNSDLIMQNVREMIGFSRNTAGEFNSRTAETTATEAQIVKAATEVRVDERRDAVADTLQDVINGMHPIIFDNWGQEQVMEMVGPGGIPVWVEISRGVLDKGRWNVKVDPETAIPETRALRERRAMEMYQVLKENPLIDPIKLTQYLLYELRGSSFDDMMKALPMPPSGVPNGPVPMSQFANMVSGSMQMAGGSVGSLERLFGAGPGNSPQLTRPRNEPDV